MDKSIWGRSDLASGCCFRLGILVSLSDGIHIVHVFLAGRWFTLGCCHSTHLALIFRDLGVGGRTLSFSGISMCTFYKLNVRPVGHLFQDFWQKKKKKLLEHLIQRKSQHKIGFGHSGI